MSVLTALAREHQVFLRLIGRIENELNGPESTARGEVRELLLVFLPALDQHEEIEESVFADPSYASVEEMKEIFLELGREHDRVNLLRAEIAQTLASMDGPWESFKTQIFELTVSLRGHFQVEERRLWPRYLRTIGRSQDRSASRRVDREVRRFVREVNKNRLIVSSYLSNLR